MANVNKVILIGNLGGDPELRHTKQGQPVCNFRLATNETFTTKSGERRKRTEWHRIVAWGPLAEICKDMLKVGHMTYIEGRLQTRQWTTKDGENRYSTEIVAKNMQSLERWPSDASEATQELNEIADDTDNISVEQ